MLDILFQDKDFIAINKPAGLSVHNAEDENNVLSLLEKQLQIEKLYPVHRLDKETSGTLILAFSSPAAKTLSDEFQNKTVQKNYIAVLRGQLTTNNGIWCKPLTNKAEGRSNPAGKSKDRIPCETRFHVIKSTPYFTLCEFQLITGRRHQIRKHAALAKHEIVGDSIYGIPKYNKKIASTFEIERMCLHCSMLVILGQKIESPIPQCFEFFFNNKP